MSHHLLLVEDELPIRQGLVDRFEREGFAVTPTADGEAALEVLAARTTQGKPHHDLVVLDLMLPGIPGEEVLVRMRERGDRTPVLVLSARGQEIDRVLLLTLGADDYVVKPFSPRELVARVRAIIRRATGSVGAVGEAIRIGQAVVDLPGFRIMHGEDIHPITATERGMIELLLQHRGRPVSRDEFLRRVWGYERVPDTRTVDFHIVRLRRKIEPDPARPRFLKTVRGAGYVLDLEGRGVKIIGITGGSGSGKSTLVEALVAEIGEDQVAVLRQDDYYRDLAHLEPEIRAATNFDHPDALDLALLAGHVDDLKSGRAISRPVYDMATHTRAPGTVRVEPREVVLIDGTLIGTHRKLRSLLDGLVFVDLDEAARLARRMERDVQERGRTTESVRLQWSTSVARMFQEFVLPERAGADLVARGDAPPEDLAGTIVARLLH